MTLGRTLMSLLAALLLTSYSAYLAQSADSPPDESSGGKGGTPSKHALLVGVWDYDRGRGGNRDWWSLHADRDVAAVDALLRQDYGFKESEVKKLTAREDTTHAAIRAAFDDLIWRTNKGDVVYFHYSGHGQQVPDPKKEEIDGSNESLVPSDYVSRQDPSNNILDKELREWLRRLKERKPASVTLVFDSCFSGDITKGGRHLVRGGRSPRLWPLQR
jgi:hypothetical protein